MTEQNIHGRLKRVGATGPEADLLAHIIYLDWHWRPAEKMTADILKTWLADFRDERALIQANAQRTRERRIAAGYRVD